MTSEAARTVRPVEEQAERALIRDRSVLLFGRSPATSFFAPLALRLQTKITRDVPTMATDGRSLFANPEFTLGLTESETAAVLIHEVLHVKFVQILAAADDNYRKNKAKFTKDSAEVKAIAKWSGAKPEDVPANISLDAFPTAKEQATKWLGGGKDSLAAKALAATAAFRLSQKQIEKALPDYSVAVNPAYAQAVAK